MRKAVLMAEPEDWRTLARELAETTDPEQILDLAEQLTRALDEHLARLDGKLTKSKSAD